MRMRESETLPISMLVLSVAATVLLCSSCGSLSLLGGSSSAEPAPVPPTAERTGAAAEAPTGTPGSGRQRVVEFLLADDQQQRMRLARELCRHQQRFVDRAEDGPAEQAALSWLADFLQPEDERARARSKLGPRSGMRDVYHDPGFEIFLEAGGGLLLFDREGIMIGRIGREHGDLTDVAFHDVDADGQSEIFLAYDSGSNSGNRFTEILGYKEVNGMLRAVLERRLYETADRWVPAGLGPRLSTVRLAGQTYIVLRQGTDAEFLRWDEAVSQLVVESTPAHRAFLD